MRFFCEVNRKTADQQAEVAVFCTPKTISC